MEVGASARQERVKLEAVETLRRPSPGLWRRNVGRVMRVMRTVRAAVEAGVRPGQVATAAGITAGRVTHITLAPKP